MKWLGLYIAYILISKRIEAVVSIGGFARLRHGEVAIIWWATTGGYAWLAGYVVISHRSY